MKKTFLKSKRMFLSMMTVMAFLFVGVQQVSAQYMHPEEAQAVLDQKVVQLMAVTDAPQLTAVSSISPSAQLEVEYVAGVAKALKTADGVQAAIDNNHSEFLAERPNFTAIATQYRDQTIALLQE